LKFGASRADGVDIDKDALLSAQNNAKMNQLEMKLYLADNVDEFTDDNQINRSVSTKDEINSIMMNEFRGNVDHSFPSVETIYHQQYEILVANILAPILIELAPRLATFVKPQGKIALSGLITKQATQVMNAFAPYFDQLQVLDTEDDWGLIIGQRK
jgi:ribosomal protein L11 methylase PrmA